MLQNLKIQNIALIPQVEIEFGRGLNVLTGETGAGKSIILGSLNFILGEKLGKNMIREGAQSARVDAVFTVNDGVARCISEISGIEIEDENIILSRILKLDGKGECRINGTIVPSNILKEVATALVHIHGQHDTEVLMRVKNHMDILDTFGRINKIEYTKAYNELKALETRLKSIGGTEDERQCQIDIYNFQIDEIDNAALKDGEDDDLAAKMTRMQSFEKISTNLAATIAMLSGEEGGAISLFKRALSGLGAVSHLDEKLATIFENAKNAQYLIGDIEDQITGYLEECEYDQDEFQRIDQRLDEIKALKRKYGKTVTEIQEFAAETRAKLERLVNSEKETAEIKQAIKQKETELAAYAKQLHDARVAAASTFQGQMTDQLGDLGMESCTFDVKINFLLQESGTAEQQLPRSGARPWSPNGMDEVEFMFSANRGEPLRPLAQVASGGEMSRFMLALKTLVAGDVGTIIFDEIDSGTGGKTAMAIAKKINLLSNTTQVICVTHLVQVAAAAGTHFLISKHENNDRTTTNVSPLNNDSRIAELARMIGGLGQSSTDAAKEMLLYFKDLH